MKAKPLVTPKIMPRRKREHGWAWEPGLRSPGFMSAAGGHFGSPVIPTHERQRQGLPGANNLATLDKLVSSGFRWETPPQQWVGKQSETTAMSLDRLYTHTCAHKPPPKENHQIQQAAVVIFIYNDFPNVFTEVRKDIKCNLKFEKF